MTTDTSESGLESLICTALTGHPCDPAAYGAGWLGGSAQDYDREHCLDLAQLSAFLQQTQPETAALLSLEEDSPTRRKFLARVQGEINKRGTIDLLRKGLKHQSHRLDLFYGTPSADNVAARQLYRQNRFSVTRQLHYSRDNAQLALDLCLFINGLPVATFELEEQLDQTDGRRRGRAVQARPQSERAAVQAGPLPGPLRGRRPRGAVLYRAGGQVPPGFCLSTRAWNDGAGNPAQPQRPQNGLPLERGPYPREPDQHYRELCPGRLSEGLRRRDRRKRSQLWPRYHQLDAVRKLLADAAARGVGARYLIQHSAGSGKSNSIAWLAHQLIDLQGERAPLFDSVIVVTDRKILDKQIRDTIKQFAQVGATVGPAHSANQLRTLLEDGKRIIISTVQKFPFILDAVGNEHRGRNFAIIIDEAHSSQGGRTATAMSMALGAAGAGAEDDEEETVEDVINRLMESKKMLGNASYFAFTATPKNKTLEIFGTPVPEGGAVRHRPFHVYTMKQAIQEGFIIDVLAHYTPVDSYYRLVKTVAGDPEFDVKRAGKKLRRYVENHDHAIRLKAEIMVDHFHEQVAGLQKVGGQARAMVVTSSIQLAISYYEAIRAYLVERNSPYSAIVAFFRRARVRGDEGQRSVAQRLFLDPDRRAHSGKTLSLPGLR